MITYDHLGLDHLGEILRSLVLFESLNAADLAGLPQEYIQVLGYDAGESLIQEGGSDRVLFVLLHGFASVVKEGAGIPMANMKPGDFFGEVGFLTGRKRLTNVVVQPPSLAPIRPQRPQLGDHILQAISKKQKKVAVVLRLDGKILQYLSPSQRLMLKNKVIDQLMARIAEMVDKVRAMQGTFMELDMAKELEKVAQRHVGLPIDSEPGRDVIINYIAEWIDRLNRQLTEVY